jgi:hypothetical protein
MCHTSRLFGRKEDATGTKIPTSDFANTMLEIGGASRVRAMTDGLDWWVRTRTRIENFVEQLSMPEEEQ